MAESQTPELTDKQARFIDEYPVDCNATAAAIRAGYSRDTARQMGSENLSKPYIRAAVDERLKSLALLADEAIKLNADIARTRLNDFMVVREEMRPGPEVSKPLYEVIADLEAEIVFEGKVAARSNLSKKERKQHEGQQRSRERKLIRLQVEFEDNPEAFRPVAGALEPVEVADLDLVSLSRAKEEGRIKGISYGQFGVKVEMYDAQAAIRDSLKMAGKFVTKVEVKDTTPINYAALSDAALEEVLNATRPATE